MLPRVPWTALVADVLASIFAFLPLAARLRAVSLTCRRWRALALRSVTALTFRGTNLPRVLALFPSLASLDLRAHAEYAVLPTTLRSLTVSASVCLYRAADTRRSALLPHLPLLTSLSIDALNKSVLSRHITALLTQFSPQLTSLEVEGPHALSVLTYPELWPLVATLHIDLTLESNHTVDLSRFPRLTNLALHGRLSQVLSHVPAANLSSITALHTCSNFTPTVATALAALPRLREVWLRESNPTKWGDGRVVACEIVRQVWRLGPLTNLRRLDVSPHNLPPAMPSLHLPSLTCLRLTHSERLWRLERVVRLVRFALDSSPVLSEVHLKLQDIHDQPEARQEIGALALEMMQRGVTVASIHTPGAEHLEPVLRPVVQYGWLRVTLTGPEPCERDPSLAEIDESWR